MSLGETRLLTLFVCIFSCLLLYSLFREGKECNCVCDYKKFENAAPSSIAQPSIEAAVKPPPVQLRSTEATTKPAVPVPDPVPAAAPATVKPRQIFIDIGANDGSSVNYFLKKDNVNYKVPWVQGGSSGGQLSGRGSQGLWDLYVVEANPHFTPKLQELRDQLVRDKKVASFTLLDSTAVTTANGPVTFHLDRHNKGKGNFGSTLVAESRSVVGVGKDLTVTGIDIVHLLLNVVKLTKEDHLVLKIDIEGSEFDVLRHMIATNVIALVDELAVEYHHSNYGVFAGRDRPDSVKEYKNKYTCLQWIMDDLNGTVSRIDWS